MRTARTITFSRDLLITMRPYLLFLSGVTGIAGLAVSGTANNVTVFLVSVAAFLSYGFGQALTDCFQTDTDAISAPYRPLVRGTIAKPEVMAASLAGLLLCSSVFALFDLRTIALGAAAVAGLATYTWFKRRWWGGPWYNAWIVVVLCLIAYLSGTEGRSVSPPAAFSALLATVFFGYANFVLAGYFKDIAADGATGYLTFPVVFGRRRAALLSHLLAGATVIALLLTLLSTPGIGGSFSATLFPLGFAAWGLVQTVRGQLLLQKNRSDADAHKPIRNVVESYVLFLSAAATAARPSWGPLMLLFVMLFLLVLAMRTEETQI